MLRNNSYRGGLACFGEIAWAGTLNQAAAWQVEVNWLELVRLSKTPKSTCAATSKWYASFEQSDALTS